MTSDLRRIAIVDHGDSALRLVRAAREYDLAHGTRLCTIAIHSPSDRHAAFVNAADEAYELPAAVVGERGGRRGTRVDLDALERALRDTRADAAWAGWGFTAVRELAELCELLGIVFIGPTADAARVL
ncbi:MAG TPA: biotin carboxylase N-terminal domain-containing protein, partial [Gemmatimonadaceae bacterium]|nr:biotin carboxylase N-terminal domain-containing protein [Gemmatimonadaceae bacterium]